MLRCPEAFYGGAVGGAKSEALLQAATQFVDVPGYAALILRKTYEDLILPGALLDRAHTFFAGTDARWKAKDHAYVFPSGARIVFSYLQHDKDVERYRSAEFQFIGFDELTQHSEQAYRFLFSRLRRPAVPCVNCRLPVNKGIDEQWRHNDPEHDDACVEPVPEPFSIAKYPPSPDGLTIFEVPLRMRSASNPGGEGHGWVKERFVDDRTRDRTAPFIPAKIDDNPYIDKAAYIEQLKRTNPIDWERLVNGDWDVRDPGEVFDRYDVPLVDAGFAHDPSVQRVRLWDTAATKVEAGKDPDWTVGVLLARDTVSGLECVEDVVRLQGAPHEVEAAMRDAAARDGRVVPIIVKREPGSEGILWISGLRRGLLAGFQVDEDIDRDGKDYRIAVLQPVVKNGEITMVIAEWNGPALAELDQWPNVRHDDFMDALAGAHAWLTAASTSGILF